MPDNVVPMVPEREPESQSYRPDYEARALEQEQRVQAMKQDAARRRMIVGLAQDTLLAENRAMREAAQAHETGSNVLRAAETASFIVYMPGAIDSPRVWVAPHIFGDVVLTSRERTTVRVLCQNVRKAFETYRQGGIEVPPI